MNPIENPSQFTAQLLRPAASGSGTPWAVVVLPKDVSAMLPRRGRATVEGALNGHGFLETLEPDGKMSHWLRIDQALLEAARADFGDVVTIKISPVEQEPDPAVPEDLLQALAAAPEARAVWSDTTSIARLDWIHWIVSAQQAKTRTQRIAKACDMLASGQRRVCCFDPSGFYSKALSAPKAAK